MVGLRARHGLGRDWGWGGGGVGEVGVVEVVGVKVAALVKVVARVDGAEGVLKDATGRALL